MNQMGCPHKKQGGDIVRNTKLWSGLTSVFAVILVIAMIGNTLAGANASYINNMLDISTARVVETANAPTDTTYYKSQFGAFDDAEAWRKQSLLPWSRISTRCARVLHC